MTRTLRDLTDGEIVELRKIIDFFSIKYGSLMAIGKSYDLSRSEMAAAKIGFRTYSDYCRAKAKERSEREKNIGFVKYLEERMNELGIIGIELAQRSGLDKQRISDYLNGKFFPGDRNMKKLAEGLDISVETLYRRTREA